MLSKKEAPLMTLPWSASPARTVSCLGSEEETVAMKSAREILSFSGVSFSGAAFVTVLRVRVVGALLTVFVVLALRAVLVCVVLRGLGFFSAASVTVAGVSDTGALSLSVIQNPEGSGDSSPDKRKIAALLSPGWEERFWGTKAKKRPCPFGNMACVCSVFRLASHPARFFTGYLQPRDRRVLARMRQLSVNVWFKQGSCGMEERKGSCP